MPPTLVFPVRIDAVWLTQAASSVGPLADYSVLPWVNAVTRRDCNPDVPFLAEAALTPPFETPTQLEAGVHLHWTLPEAMRRAAHPLDERTGAEVRDRVSFPRVPDRWLVTRSVGGAVDRRWLVQSDHLWPSRELAPDGTVTVPVPSWVRSRGQAPFRYMGRVKAQALSGPLVEANGDGWESLTGLPLTAVGPWEEMTFAALYPNCRGVFGLHDPDPPGTNCRYEVVGWYADAAKDLIAETVERWRRRPATESANQLLSRRLLLGWEGAVPSTTPTRSACFGCVELSGPSPGRGASARVEVALANSPVEALVAHIADDVDDALGMDRATAEACLHAVRCARSIEAFKLDIGPRLAHALHKEAFDAVEGGSRWRIVERGREGTRDDQKREVLLPVNVAHALAELNDAQHTLDQTKWSLEWSAEQLFCDWYRTMKATYRPSDAAQDLPETDPAMDWLRARRGEDGAGDDSTLSGLTMALDAATTARDRKREQLQQILDGHNATLPGAQAWQTCAIPSTRYWVPTEPSIVLAPADGEDPDILRSARYAEALPDPALVEVADLALLRAALPEALRTPRGGSDQNPILLEWRAEISPVRASEHIAAETRRYAPDWLARNYSLSQTEQDLQGRDASSELLAAGTSYDGRSILTPSAPIVLLGLLDAWLGRWATQQIVNWRAGQAETLEPTGQDASTLLISRLESWKTTSPIRSVETALSTLGAERSDFVQWVGKRCTLFGPSHPALVLLAAREVIEGKKDRLLGQQLTGFNRALLGLRDGVPLEMEDPLGFDAYRRETTALSDDVGDALYRTRGGVRPRTAPRPTDEFVPIRAGELRLLHLRLIDSFGRPTEVSWTELDRPATMAARRPDRVALPPRFTQPARLNFRWLSATPFDEAGHVDPESNDHPATSPICGWLVGDFLDRSILVFDANGVALGSVEDGGRWRRPPGDESGVLHVGDIVNRTLARTTRWLTDGARTPGFLDSLLDGLEAALESIDPEDYSQHEGRALLASRPVAVVRARVGIELKGPTMVDQGWHAFRKALDGQGRETRGVERVAVPVRIGEHRMLDDGVVGFFVENEAGAFLGDRLYCPQGLWADGGEGDSRVVTWEPGDPSLNVALAPGDPDCNFTLLMDPRGRVHATCGMLPTRALTVPPEHYQASLDHIALWFRAMPVLSGPGDLELDLPEEPGWRWSWAARDPDAWQRRDIHGRLRQADVEPALWASLLARGMLELDPHDPGTARWLARKDETVTLPKGFSERLRDRIVSAPRRPSDSRTAAREGWLILNYIPTSSES